MKRWRQFIAAAAVAVAAAGNIAAAGEVGAQTLGTPAPPPATLVQRLDAALPLDLRFQDADGRQVRLGDYFNAGRPVLLVLGYYRCPQLCGLLMHGVLESLHDGGVPRRDVRIVAVSIDPGDTPATARARRAVDLAYADFLLGSKAPDAPLDLHLLTGPAQDTARLAQQVGFIYERTASDDPRDGHAASSYAHPAVVIVATPTGRVSRYLMGIRFDPHEMRLALADASRGRIGSLSERIALLCAHVDLLLGRHSAAVMNATRIVGLLLVAAFALWCWRREAVPGRRP